MTLVGIMAAVLQGSGLLSEVQASSIIKTRATQITWSESIFLAPPIVTTLPTADQNVPSTFVVPVIVSDTTGDAINSFQFVMTYDPAVIVPSGANFGCSTAGTIASFMTPVCNITGVGELSVATINGTSNTLTGAGTILNITFATAGGAQAGNISPLNFVPMTLRFFDDFFQQVPNTPVNGAITLVAPPPNTPSVSNSPQMFTGSPIAIQVTCAGGGTATNIQPATATNVGSYPVTANCPAIGNFTATTNASAGNFVINPAPNTPSVSNSPQMFTGGPIAIEVICLGGGTATNITPATATNAGSYPVTANCPAIGNYSATTNASAGNFVINPAPNTPSVSNSPQIFTGNAIAIQVTCAGGGTATNITPATATSVGSYPVTANCPAIGNFSATTNASAGNFVINPAPNTPSVTNSPQIYTGNPIGITVTCVGGGTATNIQPATATNVGSYPVTANCPATGNFSATTNSYAGNFVINPAPNTPSVSNSPQMFTGNPIAIQVTCSGGGTATNITPATATNVGSYPVTADCPAIGNFSATTNASAGNFVINPANANIPSVSNSPQMYTGSPIAIQVTCSGGGTATDITPATATNVGSYPVTASCPAIGNFAGSTNAAAGNFVINPASFNTPSVSNSPQTFTGNPIAIQVTCSGGGTATNITPATATNVASYPVTASCPAIGNLGASTNASAGNFVINPANANIPSVSNSPQTFTGGPIAIQVTCSGGGTATDITPSTATNVGSYPVTASCPAIGNLGASTNAAAGNFVINPANANIPSVSNSPQTFTGGPIAIQVTCSGGGTATDITPSTATNVGSYPVTASCPAIGNLGASTNASAGNFVINPANANIPSVSNSPQTFTGGPIAIQVTCSGGGTATDITPATATNVGSYPVTASCPAIGNLGASTNASAGNFVINPANANTPSVSNSPQTFTGGPIAIQVTCSGGGTATDITPATATNVGSYPVTASCPAIGNLGASTNASAGNFVINPANANTPSVSNSPQTFTGGPIAIQVTCSGGGTATDITPATATNVGSYPVTASCPAVGNLGASTNASAGNFVINPANANTPFVSNSPQTFTGGPIAIQVTCSGGGTATNITPATATNVGSYPVTASCPAVGNLGASTNASAGNFVINAPNAFVLNVLKAGTGTGTVTSAPAGINCGADCTETYNSGTVVTLTATPTAGSTFTGWSGVGGCPGTGTCTVTMNSDATVTATFTASTPTGPWEGDINRADPTVPGSGDGVVNNIDLFWYKEFAEGRHCPTEGSGGEFQRLDGNDSGGIDAGDYTYIFNVWLELAPLVSAKGPTSRPAGLCTGVPTRPTGSGKEISDAVIADLDPPTAGIVTIDGQPGDQVLVPILIESDRELESTGFTIAYDPEVLSISRVDGFGNPDVLSGTGASPDQIIGVNSKEGRVRLGIDLSGMGGQGLQPGGTRQIALMRFTISDNASGAASTSITITPDSTLDINGNVISGVKMEGGSLMVSGSRRLMISDTIARYQRPVNVPVSLKAADGEYGVNFTASFDPALASITADDVSFADPLAACATTVDAEQADKGHIGISIACNSVGTEIPSADIVNLRFTPSALAMPGSVIPITFGLQTDVTGETGAGLPFTRQNGRIMVAGPSSAAVRVSGRVVTSDGVGIRGATVTFTDDKGHRRSVNSNALGYYDVDGIEVGQTYVVSAVAKRFRFEPRIVHVSDPLSDFDLIGLE